MNFLTREYKIRVTYNLLYECLSNKRNMCEIMIILALYNHFDTTDLQSAFKKGRVKVIGSYGFGKVMRKDDLVNQLLPIFPSVEIYKNINNMKKNGFLSERVEDGEQFICSTKECSRIIKEIVSSW